MNKKITLLAFATILASCSSKFKPDYVIIEASQDKKPVWINDLSKYEKNKNNDSQKYKYFISESESINKRLCEQSAVANVNKKISAEISNEINNTFTSSAEVQENNDILIEDYKKENMTSLVRNKLSGVEIKESYWEKRKYITELGAEKEKLVYICYQLARVKKDFHDKIINEMVNKKITEIKNGNITKNGD